MENAVPPWDSFRVWYHLLLLPPLFVVDMVLIWRLLDAPRRETVLYGQVIPTNTAALYTRPTATALDGPHV